MTPTDSLFETESPQQLAKVLESDTGVRSSLKYAKQGFVGSAHGFGASIVASLRQVDAPGEDD
jgi:hypothetical protein